MRGVCIGALGILNCSLASGRSVADTLTCVWLVLTRNKQMTTKD
jgi:hypothetical protein